MIRIDDSSWAEGCRKAKHLLWAVAILIPFGIYQVGELILWVIHNLPIDISFN